MPYDRIQMGTALTRACKGAPLAVLIHLCLDRRALGSQVLQDRTGYDKKTVAKALRTLTELGYIQHVHRYNGWCLTPQGRQLKLFGGAEFGAEGIGDADIEGEFLPLTSGEAPSGAPENDSEGEFIPLLSSHSMVGWSI